MSNVSISVTDAGTGVDGVVSLNKNKVIFVSDVGVGTDALVQFVIRHQYPLLVAIDSDY